MVISDHSGHVLLDVVGHPHLGGPPGLYKFWLSFIVWLNQSIQAWLFTEKHQLQAHLLKISFQSEHFRCFLEGSLDAKSTEGYSC